MMDVRDILTLYHERRRTLSPMHTAAMEVRKVYGGDVVLPLPELDEAQKPIVANLVMTGIDQYAARTASVMPATIAPELSNKKAKGDRARTRRDVWMMWHERNRYPILMQKRARHYFAYASSPVTVIPDKRYDRPCWKVHNPLGVLPADREVNELVPADTILVYQHSLAWLRYRYPDAFRMLNKRRDATADAQFELLEYLDGHERVLCAVGEKHDRENMYDTGTTAAGEVVELLRVENRTGTPWCVVPERVSLEHPVGQFNGVVGLYYWWAKLMALEVIGVERGIWPEEWLVSTGDRNPQIIQQADPMHGVMGVVKDGDIKPVQIDPSFVATNIIDRIERFIRLEGGVPPELGGEASTGIRTGRRGDAVLSAAIDYPIQAAHHMFEASIEKENEIAAEIDKAYYPRSKTVFISDIHGEVTYTPRNLWETTKNFVRYSQAGMDIERLTVAAGQRIGMGTFSQESFMEIDPMVRDPERERDRIAKEAINRTALEALSQRIGTDPTYLPLAVKILKRAEESSDSLVSIMAEVDEEKRKADMEAAQGQGNPLEGMPGIGEAQPPVAEQQPSLRNLTQTLMSLRTGQRLAG